MYSCSVPNNVIVYKLYTFYNFHTNMHHPKINVILVKISYFFQLHDRDMWTMYIAFFNTYISLICDKSVITQNLAFLSYWYRNERLQMHL